jgi:hypothetical protein
MLDFWWVADTGAKCEREKLLSEEENIGDPDIIISNVEITDNCKKRRNNRAVLKRA